MSIKCSKCRGYTFPPKFWPNGDLKNLEIFGEIGAESLEVGCKKGCSLSAAWGRCPPTASNTVDFLSKESVLSLSLKNLPEVTKKKWNKKTLKVRRPCFGQRKKKVTQIDTNSFGVLKNVSFPFVSFFFLSLFEGYERHQWISVPRQQQYDNNVNIDKLRFNYQKYEERRGRNQGVSDWRLERSVDWKERWHISDWWFQVITNPWYGWWKKSCTTWDV